MVYYELNSLVQYWLCLKFFKIYAWRWFSLRNWYSIDWSVFSGNRIVLGKSRKIRKCLEKTGFRQFSSLGYTRFFVFHLSVQFSHWRALQEHLFENLKALWFMSNQTFVWFYFCLNKYFEKIKNLIRILRFGGNSLSSFLFCIHFLHSWVLCIMGI